MGGQTRFFAPAKINVFLEVLGKGSDKFHNIETVMIATDRLDELTVVPRKDSRIECRMRWAYGLRARGCDLFPALPDEHENLVTRALALLQSRASIRHGMTVQVVKRIPVAAGLGGASSDAAAVLLAANTAWNLHWSRERLSCLAAELGSDIPFFLAGHGMAICRGRGERVEPIGSTSRCHLVVVRPREGLATAVVYGALTEAEREASDRHRYPPVKEVSRAPRAVAAQLFNRLQGPALRNSAETRQVASYFEQLDMLGHQLTGSGSCYFGICRNQRQARRLNRLLDARCGGYAFQVSTRGCAGPRRPLEW